jgi:tRNA (guanine26-N2/guanine27-N2)-dimethyltransferase
MKKIKEGQAELLLPEETLTKKSYAFYNPAMEHQRNVTVACVKLLKKKKILDPLAASGVRGIRLIKEADVEYVKFNDINPNATKLIEKNLKLNKISENAYAISQKDANLLFLEKEKYDYVDIDPFGSPSRFLFNVGYALHKNSLLGVTATDTGALCGKFTNACFRRYFVYAIKTSFSKEFGIRVLVTSIIKNLAQHNMTFEPIYSHANHYFRVIGLVKYGPDKNLNNIKMISYCEKCQNVKIGVEKFCDNCKGSMHILGPLWVGKIQEREFCKDLFFNFNFDGKKELLIASQESDVPFYFDIHKMAEMLKKSPPKVENVLMRLKKMGFEATRTHLCPTGIKTNASVKDILECIK